MNVLQTVCSGGRVAVRSETERAAAGHPTGTRHLQQSGTQAVPKRP